MFTREYTSDTLRILRIIKMFISISIREERWTLHEASRFLCCQHSFTSRPDNVTQHIFFFQLPTQNGLPNGVSRMLLICYTHYAEISQEFIIILVDKMQGVCLFQPIQIRAVFVAISLPLSSIRHR